VDNKLVKSTENVIIQVKRPHCWHNIAQIAFDPDDPDMMYIASGDGGGIGSRYDDHENPLSNLLGVIMRIRVTASGDYEIPEDNPFVGQSGARPEIWAYEFRHPWRITIDSIAGIWTGDVGQEKFEEVDKVESGGNYGWNKMEGTHCYPPSPTPDPSVTPTPSPSPFPPPCYDDDMTLPIAEYDHGLGCAIAVGSVYRGAAMPELDGYLIYGDYCSGRIWALDTTDDKPKPIELLNDQWGIVSLGRTGDGEIVVLAKRTIAGVEHFAILQLVRK
jgi:glucose/arabinose dehydrogenase